ncbi:MAG TPA: HAD family phosphatase [Nitrospirales bacterium]|nr:HAD family phosphatase [Nitrospirales bacterium]HIB54569.1 HAD family phosphatase [Nitrospirales bacterium]HIC05237.1 HAD family phosphatase [Nitrospirales bacterium]HIO21150.1 HAD family phosphatase [Nitrospirales bacterium]HIO70062.1 HAD family phosphatase [Nitrospirales bacterium]
MDEGWHCTRRRAVGVRVYQAIMFDFDGTLARTMEDHFQAWKTVVVEYGVDLQPEDYYPFEGMRLDELVPHIFGKYQRTVPDSKELVPKKEAYYLAHHTFELYPGVQQLLAKLQAKPFPRAVVTAGLADRVKRSAPASFLEQFDVIVTGDQTSEGKPSPVPYLTGAARLGVKPENCIVVENAPLGIESAKKAGAYCIAIASTVSKHHLEDADEIFDSFEELNDSKTLKPYLN